MNCSSLLQGGSSHSHWLEDQKGWGGGFEARFQPWDHFRSDWSYSFTFMRAVISALEPQMEKYFCAKCHLSTPWRVMIHLWLYASLFSPKMILIRLHGSRKPFLLRAERKQAQANQAWRCRSVPCQSPSLSEWTPWVPSPVWGLCR